MYIRMMGRNKGEVELEAHMAVFYSALYCSVYFCSIYRTVRVIARHGMNVLRMMVARYMPLLLRTWNFFRYEMAIHMYRGLYMNEICIYVRKYILIHKLATL